MLNAKRRIFRFLTCHVKFIVSNNVPVFSPSKLLFHKILYFQPHILFRPIKQSPIRFHGNPFSDFFWKTCLNRPADSLRCLPVTAVRPVLYRNLQSNYTQFLHFVSFCFFRWRTAVSCFSSIDRFQLVCFARVAACPPI